jgi:cobalamin biosynthesis protein CobD/CbiB
MVERFCKSGESEVVKGAVHAAGGVLAAVMAAYNLAAWCYRREAHLGINTVVYSLAVLWEIKQTAHHFERVEIACGSDGPRLVNRETTQAA